MDETSLFQHTSYLCRDYNKFEWTTEISKADIVFAMHSFFNDRSTWNRLRSDQILVDTAHLYHADHYSQDVTSLTHYMNKIYENGCPTKKLLIFHQNYLNQNHKNYIYYDICFQRHKLYYYDFQSEYSLDKRLWTAFVTKNMFLLNSLENDEFKKQKNILFPARIYKTGGDYAIRMKFRSRLRDYLLQHNEGKGYISDSSNGAFFYPNEINDCILDKLSEGEGGFFYPIGNVYYRNSYVSAYVETLVTDNPELSIHCATEKSFDPLIKGHYILPFARVNYIQHLKDAYGFKFPNWIDYSYDSIENDETRFQQYLISLQQILNLNTEDLHARRNNDYDLRVHNRNVFIETPFDSFFDKIMYSVQRLDSVPVASQIQNAFTPFSSSRHSLARKNPTLP